MGVGWGGVEGGMEGDEGFRAGPTVAQCECNQALFIKDLTGYIAANYRDYTAPCQH